MRRRDRREEWEIRLRPDRTMRGFGSTDFGERTSRLIFMSSSHDRGGERDPSTLLLRLSSGRFESDYAILTPTLTRLLTFFCGKKIFLVFGALRIWGIRGREKNEVIPASLDSFGENDFFPAKYLVTHGQTFLPSQVLFP